MTMSSLLDRTLMAPDATRPRFDPTNHLVSPVRPSQDDAR